MPDSGTSGVTRSWDWNGVVGTGQSLAVGQFGLPAQATTQPYDNLKLDTGTAEWPIDPQDPSFQLVPLTEPIGRPSTAYPSAAAASSRVWATAWSPRGAGWG